MLIGYDSTGLIIEVLQQKYKIKIQDTCYIYKYLRT